VRIRQLRPIPLLSPATTIGAERPEVTKSF
jgi:hypothetical protein